MLSSVLSDEGTPLHVRNAAALALKNALTARVSLSVIPSFPRALLTRCDHRRACDKPTTSIDGFRLTMTPRRRSSKSLSSLLGPPTKRLALLPPRSSLRSLL